MKSQEPKSGVGIPEILVVAVLSLIPITGTGAAVPAAAVTNVSVANPGAATLLEMPLDQCLKTALENNRRRPASRFAVAMAEAQHRQALSGYWPQLHVQGGYQRLDESPNFIFPATTMYIPPLPITLAPGVVISTPAQMFPVPDQDIRLMDPDSETAGLKAAWLLYDGGMRRGLREQAKGGVAAARAEVRRTDLEINDSVIRMFYGGVLARQVHQLGKDTLARMEATLNLTETMYKEGSGKVKKTDFLNNKVMVETLRAAVALLEKNEVMTQAALANTMGLAWNVSVKPAAQEIPFLPYAANLEEMVSTAYQFSPDWAKLEAGIQALEGAVRTARSGHAPKVALTGEVHRWWNDYNAGIATDRNKEGWSVGIGVQIPLFEGFLTRGKIEEARARLGKIQEEKILLKEGIGLQIKDVLLGLNAAQKQYQATLEAMKSAEENRDLNTRAYQNELVETEEVIKAQLMEAFMSAQHYLMRFGYVALQSKLNLVVGTEVWKQLRN